jgi:predicted esterase
VDTDSVVSQVSEWGRDSLISEPSLSFFIPGGASKNAVCLVFLDPQGEGMEPLRLYKNLALDFGFAMAGSNLSKNGMDIETSKVVVNQLIAKIKNESGLDSARFYILGFSGGARVALQLLLLDSDFRGAVYAGAPGPVSRYDKPLFGFAGYQDMNYADLLSFESALDSRTRHILREWPGKHEWPPAGIMEEALNWIQIKEKSNSAGPEASLSALERKWKSEKDVLKKAMYLKQSDFLWEAFSGIRRKNPVLEKLEMSSPYRKQDNLRKKELARELNLKEFYGKAFFEKDTSWWKAEIASLKSGSRFAEKDMQQRLLGFFSLASYSLAHRALQENQWPLLEQILFIYRNSDPENAEVWYLSALLSIRKQQPETAIFQLKKCKALGFKDRVRYEKEPAFRGIREKASLSFP